MFESLIQVYGMDLDRTPVSSFNEKAKKRGQAYLDRFLSPAKIAQALAKSESMELRNDEKSRENIAEESDSVLQSQHSLTIVIAS